MKNKQLSFLLIFLSITSLNMYALETITESVIKNGNLAAAAGILLSGISGAYFIKQASTSIAELETGKKANFNVSQMAIEVDATKNVSTTKALFDLVKNKMGFFVSMAILSKSINYIKENVFSVQLDTNVPALDQACFAAMIPALIVGSANLINAIQETDAGNSEYDEDISAMHYNLANRHFKVFTGSTAVIAASLLMRTVLQAVAIK